MTVELQLPSTQTVISTAASVAATAMLLRTLARDYLPRELRHYLHSKLTKTLTSFFFSSQLTVIIDEFEALSHNELFNAAELYLKPHTTPNTKRFKATMPPKENKISVTMERNEETLDTFNGVVFCWKLISKHIPSRYIQTPGSSNEYHSPKSETRHFELRFHKKHRDMAVAEYFPHVMEKAKGVNEERKTLKLFTLRSERFGGRNREKMWHSASLDHPATFDTLAMDWELKRMVMEDLDRFLGRKGLYKSVGKAWKRGYLLSGPPGTGKASLVAAMANYLNFDVYDLELTDLRRNSDCSGPKIDREQGKNAKNGNGNRLL